MRRVAACLTCAVLMLAGCQDMPTDSTRNIYAPSFAISDGAHDGNLQFYFLPPMVPQPTYIGAFDGSLSPVVHITEGEETLVDLPPSVSLEDEHYHVNWHAKDFELDSAKTYRIAVLVQGVELGYADVDVVSNGKELKNVETGEYIPLIDNRTLPIKFRIETRLTGELVDFVQHSADVDGSFVLFSNAGEVFEVSAADQGLVELRSRTGPSGIEAVTTNTYDHSIIAVTSGGSVYRFTATDSWGAGSLVAQIPSVADVVDVAQQPGGGNIVVVTGTGGVYPFNATDFSALTAQVAPELDGVVAVTAHYYDGTLLAIKSDGGIYKGRSGDGWASWQYRHNLGSETNGVEDLVQNGIGLADSPVIRTDGGLTCWYDPRNHHTCRPSNLPGSLAAIAHNNYDGMTLVISEDGVIYRTETPGSFPSWLVVGNVAGF